MGDWSRDGKGFSKQVENEKCTLRKPKNVTPPWDCLGLPVGSLLEVALGTSPSRSIPNGGYSRGQGQGAQLGANQGVTMVWMVHWAAMVAGLVGMMGSMVVVAWLWIG